MNGIRFACCVNAQDSETTAGYGYDFVELAGKELWQMADGDYEDLKRRYAKRQMVCCGCNAYCPPDIRIAGPGFDKKAALQYGEKVIKRAAALGACHVGIGSPMSRNLPENYDRRIAEDEMISFLEVTADAAELFDVNVLIEALNPTECNFVTSNHEALGLLKKVNRTNVGIVYDVYHSLISEEKPEVFLEIRPYVRHIHLCGIGTTGRRFPEKDDMERIRPYLDVIRFSGYKGIISVESSYEDITPAKEALQLLRGGEHEG